MSPSSTLTEGEIDRVVERYRDAMIRYEEAAIAVEARLRRELRAATLRALLSSRAKHPDEVRRKLLRKRSADPNLSFDKIERNLNDVVRDLAGVRVVVYDPADEARVFEILLKKLPVIPGTAEVKHADGRPYRASHLVVELDDGFDRESLRGTKVEVQVTSIAAHVFNEIEHDIGYKDHDVPLTDEVKKCLGDVQHAVRLLDRLVGYLLSARTASVDASQVTISTPEELRRALEGKAKRALNGDFVRLFRLLNAVVPRLTAVALAELGEPLALIEAGNQTRTDSVEDATAYALGLISAPDSEFLDAFREIASTWRGPPTEIKRAILGLDADEPG